jgi:putative ABC transport system permease protein
VLAALKTAPATSVLAGLTMRSWEELSPYYRQANSSYQMVLGVARLIVLIVALFSISGTLSLAILERLREIGTLRAFGTKRARVVFMFVCEGVLLGLAGAFAGGLLGYASTSVINLFGGIKMPPQPGTTEAFVIRFTPQMRNLMQNGMSIVLAALLGAMVPGFFSSRRGIAELLRSK